MCSDRAAAPRTPSRQASVLRSAPPQEDQKRLANPGPLLIAADRVHTFDPAYAGPPADAVLVAGRSVVAVGTAAELRPSARRVVELPGATLMPGLTDAHMHLTEWAMARLEVELGPARSPADAASLVAEAAARQRGDWIRGRGWNANRWDGAVPDATVLAGIGEGRPIALQSQDMHSLWVNDAALQRAGIDETTADPPGGVIVRDGRGRPTGLLLENAAQLVALRIPVPTLEQVRAAVLDAQRELHTLGITGVHGFPGIHLPEPEALAVLESLRADDLLRLRVLQHFRVEQLDAALALGLRSGFGGDWIRIGAVKMFLDGALGSRTAWMSEPYQDSTDVGVRTLEPDVFADHVRRAAAAGIATTVHAIGDAAVRLALDVLERHRAPAALPHRVEHVQCCPPALLARFGAAGIVASMQPCHLITDWQTADRQWGAERTPWTFALASLLRCGTVLAFGSDAPVEPVDPRRGVYAAVCRLDLDGAPAGGWQPGERITPLAAWLGYTAGPALAAGLAGRTGRLAPGAAADITAWDADPLQLHDERILDVRCTATFVGGQAVHQRTDCGIEELCERRS
jgi:predicted amidohydrolase YtcJ